MKEIDVRILREGALLLLAFPAKELARLNPEEMQNVVNLAQQIVEKDRGQHGD